MGVKATAKKTPGRKPKAASVPKPRAKKVTGRLGDRVAVLGGRMDKIDRAVLQMTASIAESNARYDARHAETEARIAEIDALIAESNANINKTIQTLSEKLEKISEDLANSLKNLGGNVGDVNNRLGEIVELVVLPGLMEEMNTTFGYNFDNASPRKRFTDSGQEYAEIDLFLENGESVMAVEAKTRFTLGMVNSFIKQVESLREHEIKAGVTGKKIYAAIAGLGIDANAKTFALERWIYVVMIDHSSNKVTIESPKGAVRTW